MNECVSGRMGWVEYEHTTKWTKFSGNPIKGLEEFYLDGSGDKKDWGLCDENEEYEK